MVHIYIHRKKSRVVDEDAYHVIQGPQREVKTSRAVALELGRNRALSFPEYGTVEVRTGSGKSIATFSPEAPQRQKSSLLGRAASYMLNSDVRGPSKTTIAQEALRQLNFIHEMLTESGNWDVGGVEYHSNSANNYLQSLKAGGISNPDWVERNRRFLSAHRWRIP